MNIPLSEQVAEGWHRTTRLSKIRAPAAKIPWCLATARLEDNIQICKEWCNTSAGMRAFRFEWQRWKRLLQTRHSRGRDQWRKEDFQEALYERGL